MSGKPPEINNHANPQDFISFDLGKPPAFVLDDEFSIHTDLLDQNIGTKLIEANVLPAIPYEKVDLLLILPPKIRLTSAPTSTQAP